MKKSLNKVALFATVVSALIIPCGTFAGVIVSGVERSVRTSTDLGPLVDQELAVGGSALGPISIHADSYLNFGMSWSTATASQDSTVGLDGFSYQSSLTTYGRFYTDEGPYYSVGDQLAKSVFRVTYELDGPYAYEFSVSTQGMNVFPVVRAPFAAGAGVLDAGSYSFSVDDMIISAMRDYPETLTGSTTVSLRLTPVPDAGATFGLLTLGCLCLAGWRRRCVV